MGTHPPSFTGKFKHTEDWLLLLMLLLLVA